jgi:hypothetical protein
MALAGGGPATAHPEKAETGTACRWLGLALAGCLDALAQFAAHGKGGADAEEGKWGGYLSSSLAKGILDVVDNPIGVGLYIPILPDV